MAEIVNLRLARKRRERAAREETAAQNRALHGRTKAEKFRDRTNAEKGRTFVEAHRREPDDGNR